MIRNLDDEDWVEEEDKSELRKPHWRRKSVSRKKEPLKPWGRKERLLVLAALLVTSLTSAFLAASAREWKFSGLPRLSLPRLTFLKPIFEGQEFVFEGDKEKERETIEIKNKEKASQIISRFKGETNQLSGIYGLYVIDLTNGYSFGVNEEESFEAASLVKLPVMAAMYRLAEEGGISLETTYALKNSDKAEGAGVLFSKPVGYTLTYREILELMGKHSDNTAFVIARQRVGRERIESLIKDVGMNKTDFETRRTTPKDIGLFFQQLYQGKVINENDKDELLKFLTDTDFEEWLKAGLPAEIRIAHKFGTLPGVVNDAGIVFAPNHPYVVVIMSKGAVEKEAKTIFPVISGFIFGVMIND